MKALITGGAGFAGSHLTEYLLRQGQEVCVFVSSDETLANVEHLGGQITIERGDLRDASRVLALLKDIRPQRIYHLAALSSPADSLREPALCYAVNFWGTFNLLSAWQQIGFESRFLFVSSSQVYGSIREGELAAREETALQPENPYSGSKAAAEMLVLQFHNNYGLPIVRARPFNHTGPRQSPNFACSSFARQIAEIDLGRREPVVRVGNLKSFRDFSDVRDIVRGYHLLLEQGEPGEVYQLASGRCVSMEFILHSLLALSSRQVQVMAEDSRSSNADSVKMWGDPSKAEKAVGWRPEYELQTTLFDLKRYWESVIQSYPTQSFPSEV
jgi:GDP-4-dehydro-6-deoxy-D-mannose reductase